MKIKDIRRSSHRRKLFSLNTSYHSVEHNDDGEDHTGLLQEESPKTLEFPMMYTTKPSSPKSNELVGKEAEECLPTPDSFFELLDGRNFDFASVLNEETEPFTTETAPIVAGGSTAVLNDGFTREAPLEQKRRKSSLWEWPEDNMNEELVEEAWQEPDAPVVGDYSSPAKAPMPEHVVSGTIELKTADQPSGITFQKTDHICPLKIQGFSPFSQFKTKTDLKPGMVVLEINGRDMTWASTKEAVLEIKKAKPGTVTITAIAPSKLESAPKAFVDKISTPPTPFTAKKENELVSGLATSAPTIKTMDSPPKQPQNVGNEAKSTIEPDETVLGIARSPFAAHYRDPTLMMMDSVLTEPSEDATGGVKISGGPSFKELNPSFLRVDSAVTADDAGASLKPTPENGVTHPTHTRSSAPLLGGMNDEVEMDVVYVDDDLSEDEEDVTKEPETKPDPIKLEPIKLEPIKLDRSRHSPKVNVNRESNPKPPMHPKHGPSLTESEDDSPSATKKQKRDEASSSADAATKQDKKEDGKKEKEEEVEEGLFFCNALDAHIAPLLATMKDFSNVANRITERMPSWMRVICHE